MSTIEVSPNSWRASKHTVAHFSKCLSEADPSGVTSWKHPPDIPRTLEAVTSLLIMRCTYHIWRTSLHRWDKQHLLHTQPLDLLLDYRLYVAYRCHASRLKLHPNWQLQKAFANSPSPCLKPLLYTPTPLTNSLLLN